MRPKSVRPATPTPKRPQDRRTTGRVGRSVNRDGNADMTAQCRPGYCGVIIDSRERRVRDK